MTQLDLDFSTASPINKEKFAKQNKLIYEALERGEIMDIHKAIGMSVYNLHSRISDLRNKHDILIYSRFVTKNGMTYNEYSLTAFEKQAA